MSKRAPGIGRYPTTSREAVRERLAQIAARFISEQGIRDFGLAKRKAAETLGVADLGALPTNTHIEASLAERQRIFEPLAHRERVAELRRVALILMQELRAFAPRLVGAVLEGTPTGNTAIELHAFSDTPELVAASLGQLGVNLHDCERRYRFTSQRTERIPGYRLVREGAEALIVVFSENGRREAPLSPVDKRPMRRAAEAEVSTLGRLLKQPLVAPGVPHCKF